MRIGEEAAVVYVGLRSLSHGGRMNFRRPTARVCAASLSVSALALGLAACGGGGDGGAKKSATDATSGLTVTVSDDQVSLKRTAKSTSGTAGTSGTVSCTDDYAKLVKASATPAPTQSWYATTLITWPAANKESKATLSHSLKGDPQLCVAQTSDSSASAIIYFDAKAKAGVAKLQTDTAKTQQASQASAALKAAATAAVSGVSAKKFPDAKTLVAAVTSQGLYAKEAASLSAVTETGTIYVVDDKTSTTSVVLALKDSKGKVQTATQGVTGSPKIAAAS
jgi:hypothetical protein